MTRITAPADLARLFDAFNAHDIDAIMGFFADSAVFDAVAANRFYVIPHSRIKQAVRLRMEDILEDRNPTPL